MKGQKRKDYLSWDEYFMAIALLSAERSKDPSTQVGACIVSPDKKVVGVGYNGFPRGCSDTDLPWSREAENPNDTKYPYVCHAELNAIINAPKKDLNNCILYVCMYPCNECAKAIIQSGIKEVIYLSNKYGETSSCQASKRMFKLAGIKTKKYVPKKMTILLNHGKHY